MWTVLDPTQRSRNLLRFSLSQLLQIACEIFLSMKEIEFNFLCYISLFSAEGFKSKIEESK